MPRRKGELQAECGANMLPTEGTREQLMDRLRDYYWANGQVVSPRPMAVQVPSMITQNSKDLPEDKFAALISSSSWIAEYKIDGMRTKLHLGETENRLDSRHRSLASYEYVENTDRLPQFRNAPIPDLAGTVLDGELVEPNRIINTGSVVTSEARSATTAIMNSLPERAVEIQEREGWCELHLFDMPFFCGHDIRGYSFGQRRAMLVDMFDVLNDAMPQLFLLDQFAGDFKEHYDRALDFGFEGLMLKHLHGQYELTGTKRVAHQLKWKAMMDTDVFISGFTPGKPDTAFAALIGSFMVSMHDQCGNIVEVGACQPGPLATRRDATIFVDGQMTLNPLYMDKVIEVTYQFKTGNGRLTHCVLAKYRPDKQPADCVMVI